MIYIYSKMQLNIEFESELNIKQTILKIGGKKQKKERKKKQFYLTKISTFF